jgi:hypothetical protein
VVGFTIGSRGKVPGKTCEKRRNNNNNNNNNMLLLCYVVKHILYSSNISGLVQRFLPDRRILTFPQSIECITRGLVIPDFNLLKPNEREKRKWGESSERYYI